MDNIFLNNDESNPNNDKINLDELFTYKKQCDLNLLASFKKVLDRAHTRIKTTSRQKGNSQCCWFLVPEVMIGVPKYSVSSCIAYIINKLNDNGFAVKYTHPNLLFISWAHWIPDYVRSEVKKQSGKVIDGYGNLVDKSKKDDNLDMSNPNNLLVKTNETNKKLNIKKEFTPINSYKPTGNFVYADDLFERIEDKTS